MRHKSVYHIVADDERQHSERGFFLLDHRRALFRDHIPEIDLVRGLEQTFADGFRNAFFQALDLLAVGKRERERFRGLRLTVAL